MTQDTDTTPAAGGPTQDEIDRAAAAQVAAEVGGGPAGVPADAADTAPAGEAAAPAPAAEPDPAEVAEIEEALKDVIDPELGVNIVDLGLVYGIHEAEDATVIDMTLTSAACPLTEMIEDQTAQVLDGLVAHHRINWVWMPPWGPERITEDGREQMRALGFNI